MQGGELQRTWRQFLLALGTDSCRPGIPETPTSHGAPSPYSQGAARRKRHPGDLRQLRGVWVEWRGLWWALTHTGCGCLDNGLGVYFVADSKLTLFCKCSFPTVSRDSVFRPLPLGVTALLLDLLMPAWHAPPLLGAASTWGLMLSIPRVPRGQVCGPPFPQGKGVCLSQ